MADPRSGGWSLPPSLLDDSSAASGLGSAGLITSIFGGLNSAVGAYFAVNAQRNELKSRALSLEFEQSMSNINARNAENEAQSILEAGRDEIGRQTMRAGQERAAVQASTAGRGVEGNVGSAAEQIAAMDLVKEIDTMTINSNAVRAANASRMQGVNYRNQGLLAGVSAQNVRRTAGSLSHGAAVTSDLLGSGGQVASQWFNRRGY